MTETELDTSLERFVTAQDQEWPAPINEIKSGRKQGHWSWYVFPQIGGLGKSNYAMRFAIKDLDEARAYLAHPVLGPRLIETCEALLSIDGRSAKAILGPIDMLKLQSCMTLFEMVDGGDIFGQVLRKYYTGQRCPETRNLVPAG